MEDEKIFDFCVSQSQRLADLVGNKSDLLMVGVLVDAYLKYPQQSDSLQSLYRSAFCFSAIITYGRTFGSGARESLPRAVIDELEPEWIEAHTYFKSLRDKWIAHSANNFEQSRVTLQVKFDPSGGALPTQVGDGHKMTVSLSSDDMRRLKGLATRLLDSLSPEIDREKERVLAYAKTLDLGELQRNPNKYARPDEAHVHDRRRQRFGE